MRKNMRNIIFLIVLLLTITSCSRVEPGHVGIVVNYYGPDRGVSEIPTVTGTNLYNPITTSILEYPTFVQTAVWTRGKGDEPNEEISFSSKEGMVITADVSLSIQLVAKKVPEFYVKFRTDDLRDFIHGYLRNVARDSFNEESVAYPLEDLYSTKKEIFLAKVRERVNNSVQSFGVQILQFGFVGAARLPQNVMAAINEKITATQRAIQIENELRSSEAEAKKAVAKAEGEARATITLAEGQAKANRLLSESVNSNLIQWKALDKWNGTLPQVTGQSVPFVGVK